MVALIQCFEPFVNYIISIRNAKEISPFMATKCNKVN